MFRKSRLVALLLPLTIAAGCDDDGITTPTGTTVVMYQNTNYQRRQPGIDSQRT